MIIQKTIHGDTGKLYLFWGNRLIGECESYLLQVVTPSIIECAGGLIGIPTGDAIILTLEKVKITSQCRAAELVAAFRNGERPLFSFRGDIKRPDGYFDEIVLTECATQADVDVCGISAGLVPIWAFEAGIHEDELAKIKGM